MYLLGVCLHFYIIKSVSTILCLTSRCMQGLMYAGAEKNIIDVLQVQKLMNKNGGKKFVPLSKHAKIAFENKTRVYY